MRKHISIFTFLLCAFAAVGWTGVEGAVKTAGFPYYTQSGTTVSDVNVVYSTDAVNYIAIPPAGRKVGNWGWANDGSAAQQYKGVTWEDPAKTGTTYAVPSGKRAAVYFAYIPLKVSFNGNGGSGSMNPIEDLNYDSEITLPANTFVKTGYHFNGWKTNATEGVVFADKAKLKGGAFWNGKSYDSTLYAQWVPNTYTVHFDGNGASGGSMADETFTYGETKALTANAFEKDGFAFAGWATNAVAGEVVYEDKESVRNLTTNENETINLYARWTQKYTVTFREDEKFRDTTPEKDGVIKVEYVVRGDSATPPADPAHEGYRFNGWSGNYTGVTKNENVYATYQGNSYRIILHANDGSGRVSEDPRVYGEAAKELLPMTRTGYVLKGWAESPDAIEPKYQPGEKVANLATGGEVHLYALWTPISYSVAFNANGGEGTMDPVSLEYGEAYVVPECVFTKTGCEFQSWQVLIGGKAVTNYLAGTTVSNLTSEANGTVTFKAEWLGRYTLAFDANGGEGMMETTNVERDVGFQLPSNTFTRIGYDFMTWTTNLPPSEKSIIADGATVTNLVAVGETCTLCALWDPHHYTIIFDANGGKGENPPNKSCVYGKEYELPRDWPYTPPKNYATFIGWSTNKNDVGGVYTVSNLTAKANGIVTVYAVWKYDVGEWSRVLDCDNLMFTSSGTLPWVAITNSSGGLSPAYAYHNDKAWSGNQGLLSAVVDESGALSFWWKAVDEQDWLTVECTTVDGHTVLFTKDLPWKSDDWVTDSLRIDLPFGMDAVQVRFVHSNPADIFLDCVTWVPDGGGEPTPGDPVAVTAAGVENGVFSLTIPAKSVESGTDYGVWTNADLTVDSWGLMGDPQPGEGKPLEFRWTIIPGFPQLFFRAHKVEYK